MKEYILDTNALLRFLRNDIPAQAVEVDELFQSAQDGLAIITIYPFVILEAMYVLWKQYGHEKNDVAAQLVIIVDNPLFDVREKDALREALTEWSRGAISFVDAYLLFQSRQENKTLFTFDLKLKKAFRRLQ